MGQYRPDFMEAGILTPLSPFIIFPFWPDPSSSLDRLIKFFFLGSQRCLGRVGAKDVPSSSARFMVTRRDASANELAG